MLCMGGGAQAFSFSLVGCESAVELNKHNPNNRFQIKAVYSPQKNKQTPKWSLRADIKAIEW